MENNVDKALGNCNNIVENQDNDIEPRAIPNDLGREKRRKKMSDKWKIQFITNNAGGYSHIDGVRLALEGGCKWIQLRMKDCEEKDIKATALEMKELCYSYGAMFLIDDNVEIALKVKADGVHLGKNDMSPIQAREILGDDFIIGGTANTINDIRYLITQGVDYIGCGPFRFTSTKKNLSPIIGIEGYGDIVRTMKEEGMKTMMVAIGGIKVSDIKVLIKKGIEGVAVSSAILDSDNPVDEMQKMIREFQKDIVK
ncbi:MAG: thiamine phosphate synthase [Candidatus Limimorpha sp.]